MAIESTDERFLTVAEVAERLKVHPITVRRHIKAGRLRAVRFGRAVRIRESDLDAYVAPEGTPSAELPYRWPPTPEEIARRTKLMKEAFARRDARPLLGITTTELVRQARGARDWMYEDEPDDEG